MLLSYTPYRDTAISPGVGYLYPPPPIEPMLYYPTELLLRTTTTNVQLNKLPQTTIIFRIIDGTIMQYVSVVTASNDTLTFYSHFEMPNIY